MVGGGRDWMAVESPGELIHAHIHTPDGGVNHARRQLIRSLAHGHLDTPGGARDGTSNLPVTSQTALPPEPLLK